MIIFEPPPGLTGGAAQVWIGASGGNGVTADPNWGGANVWLSLDGATYAQVGQVTAPIREGVLTAPLPGYAGANPDTVDTLAVDLTMSGGALLSTSAQDAASGGALCLVDRELVSYTTATLTAPCRYGLTGLYRGLYGSTPATHAAGAKVARLDGAVFVLPVPLAYIGRPLSLKFQSFNVFGGGVQNISTCAVFGYTPIGSGIFGPATSALAVGTALDWGLASQPVTQSDDWGLASDPYVNIVDLGLASS